MITIHISSEGTKSGKTSVAMIIAKALFDANITGVVLSCDTYKSLEEKFFTNPKELSSRVTEAEVTIYDDANTEFIEEKGGAFGF